MPKTSKKPNILWICTDQQRYDTLGCYGNRLVKTPNIDRLASMGVLFENCYCQSPVCAPSRASFLTGRYPRTCRLRQNGQTLPPDEVLVTKIFADHGYMCGLSGKLHLAACSPSVCKVMESRTDDGYHYFRWSHEPIEPGGGWALDEYSAWLKKNGSEYRTTPYKGSKYVEKGMPSELHHSTWCTDRAIDFIEMAEGHDTPWLYSLNLFDPHNSFDPPSDYLERYIKILDQIPLPTYAKGELDQKPVFQRKDHAGAYDNPGVLAFGGMSGDEHRLIKAAYWAMVDHIDTQVGRLLDTLEKKELLKDTIVIFMSDHGEMLGDHGIYLKGPYFYEGGTHVPLIIAWPEMIEGGRRSGALVELVDIAPTLLDAAGLPIQPGMQGKSLWSILKGDSPAGFHRENVYCEFYNSNIRHRNPLAYATMLFDGRYKIVKVHGDENEVGCTGELYDRECDPDEKLNCWNDAEYAGVKIRMLEKLCDRMALTCDPLPVRQAYW